MRTRFHRAAIVYIRSPWRACVKIAVTGASGFVARAFVAGVGAHHKLVGISRSGTGYGITRMARAMRGCEVVVHLAGSGKPDGWGYANAQLTDAVVRAAKQAGVHRIVYLSGLGVSAKNTSAYFASKLEAERLVRSSGLEYALLRPSYIVGKSDYLTHSLRSQARRGKVLVPGDGSYTLQPVLIHEAVHVIENAAHGKRFVGRALDLVGPAKISFAQYVRFFLRSSGLAASIKHVPLGEALRLSVSGNFPYSADDMYLLLGGFEGDYEKLRRAHGTDLTDPRRAQAGRRDRFPPK